MKTVPKTPRATRPLKPRSFGGRGEGKDDSRFVAVQQWVRDLSHFVSLFEPKGDNIIGRRISDNEVIDDAPDSAHVKCTALESFEPEDFET